MAVPPGRMEFGDALAVLIRNADPLSVALHHEPGFLALKPREQLFGRLHPIEPDAELDNQLGLQREFVPAAMLRAGRLNQLWWRHFRKTTLNYAGTSPYYLKTYQSNDSSPATTQTVSDTGSLQTVDQAT